MAQYTDEIHQSLLRDEGLYDNDVDDPGGETYKGIARSKDKNWSGWVVIDQAKREIAEWQDFEKGMASKKTYRVSVTKAGKALEALLRQNSTFQASVRSYYKKLYWDVIRGDEINSQEIAYALFDAAVNQGAGAARSQLKKAINQLVRVKLSGTKFTDEWLKAINVLIDNQESLGKFGKNLKKFRLEAYDALIKAKPKFSKYEKGWKNRVERVFKDIPKKISGVKIVDSAPTRPTSPPKNRPIKIFVGGKEVTDFDEIPDYEKSPPLPPKGGSNNFPKIQLPQINKENQIWDKAYQQNVQTAKGEAKDIQKEKNQQAKKKQTINVATGVIATELATTATTLSQSGKKDSKQALVEGGVNLITQPGEQMLTSEGNKSTVLATESLAKTNYGQAGKHAASAAGFYAAAAAAKGLADAMKSSLMGDDAEAKAAKGGIFDRPTSVLMGEAGESEAVLPLSKLTPPFQKQGHIEVGSFVSILPGDRGIKNSGGGSPEDDSTAFLRMRQAARRRAGRRNI